MFIRTLAVVQLLRGALFIYFSLFLSVLDFKIVSTALSLSLLIFPSAVSNLSLIPSNVFSSHSLKLLPLVVKFGI